MRRRLGGLWHNPDFLKLWTAQAVSKFGSLITGTALAFTAILALDATPVQMALLAASGIVPGLLGGLLAGVWVDRLPRRPILIITDLGRAVLLGTIPLAALFDALTLSQLYVVAFGTGLLTIFFDVAYQSYLPALIGRDELVEGNSKLAASASVAEFSAFSASGWLVQLLSGPAAILVDAVTFVVSAVCIGAIRRPEPPIPPTERAGVRGEVLDGLRVALGRPDLRAITASVAGQELGYGIVGAVYMLYVTRELEFQPGVLGVIFGIGGVSALAGAMLAGASARRFGIGPAMAGGLAIAGLSSLFLPLAPEASLAGAAFLIAQQLTGDSSATVYEVHQVSLRQSLAPERVIGRVNATTRFLGLFASLTGALLGGLLGETLGLRTTITIGSLAFLAGALWLALSPVGRMRRAPLVAEEAVVVG